MPVRSIPTDMNVAPPLPPIKSKQPGVTNSLLYSGSRFVGHQKSKGNQYDVEVILQVRFPSTMNYIDRARISEQWHQKKPFFNCVNHEMTESWCAHCDLILGTIKYVSTSFQTVQCRKCRIITWFFPVKLQCSSIISHFIDTENGATIFVSVFEILAQTISFACYSDTYHLISYFLF